MIWNKRDPFRWRKCFALFPKRIDERWIWLERYAWRPLTEEETPSEDTIIRSEYGSITLPAVFGCSWEEHTLRDGYTRWRKSRYTGLSSPLFSGYVHSWHRPKPKLRAVS